MGAPDSAPKETGGHLKPFSSRFANELLKLQKTGLLRRVPAGSNVFEEGDAGDGLFLVERGRIVLTTKIDQGRGRIINRVEAGDYFGEMALLDDGSRSATATAEMDSIVSFIPKCDVMELLKHSPTIVFDMLREFSQRMRATNRQVIEEVVDAERIGLLGRFSQSFAHDMKNPLAGIAMGAELLAEGDLLPELRKQISGQLVRQARRVAMMTEEMLAISRGAKPMLDLRPVNLADYLQKRLDEFRIDFRSRRLDISFENLPPDLTMQFDPNRLEQALLNLLHNSADVLPAGGRVVLRFETLENAVAIEIEDNGPGISKERIEQVFQPFFTFGKTRGTGLGLSICRRVLEAHGGSIRALHQTGRGAIFRLELPLQPNPARSDPLPVRTGQTSGRTG
jgi:signal transduction histidine kinase